MLQGRGIGCVIPKPKNQRRGGFFDRQADRERNQVERLFARLKQFRKLATRYDKRAEHFLAFLYLASIRIWLKDLSQPFADTP